MTIGGWVTMGLSLAAVWGAALWSLSRVLRKGSVPMAVGDD